MHGTLYAGQLTVTSGDGNDVIRSMGAYGEGDLTSLLAFLTVEMIADNKHLPSTLMTLACVGYYSDERVITVLKGDARPPHPLGYEIEADDFSLLDRVRARGKLYREC